MRGKDYNFTVNGQPLLSPDEGVDFSYEDLDAQDSGRDESGYMMRSVLRYKVGKWGFVYSNLTEEERQYLESIFPNAPDFVFGHPSRQDASSQEYTVCYRSKYGISWKNSRTKLWQNLKFNIIEC